jgi:Fe-S oxidoreductase
MKKLIRTLRRAIRRVKPDIVAVMCPTCKHMMNAFEKHQCERDLH